MGMTGGPSSGWGGTPADLSVIADHTAPSGGGLITRLTHASAGTASNGGDLGYGAGVPIALNTPYTQSIFVRSSAPLVVRPQVQLLTSTGAGTGIIQGQVLQLTPGEWTRLSLTASISAETAYAWRLDTDSAGAVAYPAGTTLDFDAAMVEQSSELRPFFDGDSAVNAETINGVTPPPAVLTLVLMCGLFAWTRPSGGGQHEGRSDGRAHRPRVGACVHAGCERDMAAEWSLDTGRCPGCTLSTCLASQRSYARELRCCACQRRRRKDRGAERDAASRRSGRRGFHGWGGDLAGHCIGVGQQRVSSGHRHSAISSPRSVDAVPGALHSASGCGDDPSIHHRADERHGGNVPGLRRSAVDHREHALAVSRWSL